MRKTQQLILSNIKDLALQSAKAVTGKSDLTKIESTNIINAMERNCQYLEECSLDKNNNLEYRREYTTHINITALPCILKFIIKQNTQSVDWKYNIELEDNTELSLDNSFKIEMQNTSDKTNGTYSLSMLYDKNRLFIKLIKAYREKIKETVDFDVIFKFFNAKSRPKKERIINIIETTIG